MEFFDKVSPTNVRRTVDGYLVADAPVARTGIQLYSGAQVGKAELDVVRVYRPESEVFASDSITTYAHRPLTNDHPAELVDAANWKKYSIGQTGGEVVRDGDLVRVPLVMMDAAAISDFENGKRELSMGYVADIDFTPGTTPSGEPYDAVQRNLRMNHLALVDRARGGDRLKIGDDHKRGTNMSNTKVIVVDGLQVETTEAGALAIAKLQKTIADRDAMQAMNDSAHAKALADRDVEIAKRDAEIASLKAKVLSDADLDARVSARAALVASANSVVTADYAGKSDAEIRAHVVRTKLGDAALTNRSQAYIDARFDMLVEDAAKANPTDPVRNAIKDGGGSSQQSDSQTAYERRIADGWKSTPANA